MPWALRLVFLVVLWLAPGFAAGVLALESPRFEVAAREWPAVDASVRTDPYSLEGVWLFQPGDDPAWAEPSLDDSAWQARALPERWSDNGYPETGQLGWYRLRLVLTDGALANYNIDAGLGIRLGKILSAYEIYANGRLLGGVGRLPPIARVDYDREKVYHLPRDLVGPAGELVLALRVWGGSDIMAEHWGGGPYGGGYSLGDYRDLLLYGVVDEVPAVALCTLFLGFGLYHLYLYRRNRQEKLFLWFGLLAINIALYGLMLTQVKYLLPMSFQVLKEVEIGAIYFMPVLALQMIWVLLDAPVTWIMRAYQLSFIPLVLIGVLEPVTDTHARTLAYFQLWSIPILLICPIQVWQKMRSGHPEARTLFIGLLIFGATCANDILIDLARVESARLITVGFMALMLAMAVSLGNRFTTMLNRLEQEVADRTLALSEANRRLAEAARQDPLTGLLNRRGFVEEAEAEIKRVFRRGGEFSVVLADIDHFKQLNDRFGHACGDHVLSRVSTVLQRRLRDVDRVARWGGEEFIFLLPETGLEGATVLAGKLRDEVAENMFEYKDHRLQITMTFGIARHRTGEPLDACIARADSALYEGKKQGRNQVMGESQGLALVT